VGRRARLIECQNGTAKTGRRETGGRFVSTPEKNRGFPAIRNSLTYITRREWPITAIFTGFDGFAMSRAFI
jgi:hypothetical protein